MPVGGGGPLVSALCLFLAMFNINNVIGSG